MNKDCTQNHITGRGETDRLKGLSENEVKKRFSEFGENVLEEGKKKTAFGLFMEQLDDPLILVLAAAAAASMVLKEYGDMLIILVVVLLNAVVGMVQEGKAQKALDALKKLTSPTAVVRRDGMIKEIPASKLVPGDVVCLEAGRLVPADIRLTTSAGLSVEESALTGESVPVQKDAGYRSRQHTAMADRRDMVYMSSTVSGGRAEGIVEATGMNTEIGKIAGLINETHKEMTPLQKRLADLGKLLSILAIGLCAGLFFLAVLQKRNIGEMLITAISLAVAAVPEGLPAVVTITLALSVSRMVKVNAIVRRLPSVETLGAVNVVCSDKTGTLTLNRMTVTRCYADRKIFPSDKMGPYRESEWMKGFTLCNDAVLNKESRIGDPTELALLDMAAKENLYREALEKKYPRIGEIAFDSGRKMMTTLHRNGQSTISFTKGSCDEIIKHCTSVLLNGKKVPMTEQHRREIKNTMETMASDALRVLALAMREGDKQPEERNMTFIGMAGMIDPPREEAAGAIEMFKEASVKTVMITGDHIDTAYTIAKGLNIAQKKSECITGEELNRMSDKELAKRVEGLSVYARVTPEHKVRIVKALKANGNIVAMTGDGVNDAPSLKAADIGIAMGVNGTDVAKNASDLILADDNFATIEKAIEEGRGIYANIKKSVLFLLSSNLGEIMVMFLSILVGFVSPLKASHILWINLITDSLPALALGTDKNDVRHLMDKPPRKADEHLFAHGGMFNTLFYGALIAGISLVAFLTLPYLYIKENNLAFTIANLAVPLSNPSILMHAQTYAFTVLGMSQLFHAIGMRDTEISVFKMNHLSNRLMIAAFILGMILQVLVTEIPVLIPLFGTVKLTRKEWAGLMFLASMPILAHECLLIRKKR